MFLQFCFFITVWATPCVKLVNSASGQSDPTTISVGGAYGDAALFLSQWALYSVTTDTSVSKPPLSVSQAAIGKYQARTGVVTRYYTADLFVALIPSASTNLHFLSVQNGVLNEVYPAMALGRVLPSGFSAQAAGVMTDALGNMENFFFADAEWIVRLCPMAGAPNSLSMYSVFNISSFFANPLGVDTATSVSVEENQLKLFVSRQRAGSSADSAADVLVLELVGGCDMQGENQIFVQPAPIAAEVAKAAANYGAKFYWAMAPGPSKQDTGTLYAWDLSGLGNENSLALGLAPDAVVSPVGFVEPLDMWAYYGLIVSQRPRSRDVDVAVIDAGDVTDPDHLGVACRAALRIALPTAAAALRDPTPGFALGRYVIFAADNAAFSLVYAPVPSTSSSDAGLFSTRKRAALSTCVATHFGYPATCDGCTPPSAVCGCTEQCPSGCCFVVGARVMCCTQSPLSSTPGFSCN